jgi:hypothetical protein
MHTAVALLLSIVAPAPTCEAELEVVLFYLITILIYSLVITTAAQGLLTHKGTHRLCSI